MRTRVIILLLFILARHTSSGQALFGLSRDSLRRAAAATPDVGTFIALGQQYEANQTDSAIYFYELARQLAIKLEDHDGYVRYVSNYSAVLNMRGKYGESLQLNRGTIDTCLKYHLTGMSYIRALLNTGNVYELIGNHDSAAVYYLKVLPEVEASGDSYRVTVVYNNLSGLYRSLHQPAKALDYSRSALKQAQKIDDQYSIASAYINMGNALTDLGRFEEGYQNHQKAYEIGRQLHDSATMEMALIDIGDTWLKQGKPEKYMPVYQQALALGHALKDVSGTAYSQQGLANGLFWTAHYKEAETLLKEAIPFARDNDQREVWHGMLLLMSDVQAILGHMDAYRRYRDQADSVSDLIINASVVKNVQELEAKYQLLKKDLQLAEKDRQASRQRIGLIATTTGIVVLIILFLLTLYISRQRRQLHRLEGQYQERQRISQEMHDDMGSGLTRLLFQSRALQAPEMSQTAEQLIRKMSEIIWTLNHEQDTLDSLIAYIRTNAAQMAEAASFEFNMTSTGIDDRPVSQEFRRNVYLAAKEAVHNAIKHSGGNTLHISATAGDALTITIQDNGKGFDPDNTHRWGNGLKNMQKRMEQIGGKLKIAGATITLVIFI
ncbi:MAG: tetratricopeptide repeat protein [Bacteroidetes bacterium]|nr:tetratricopeptide repeat protein [Bacteroidota bacterium]